VLLIAVAVAVVAAVYALLVAGLFLAGRHADAKAVARFVPDCVVLFRRLLADPRVPRRRKLLLGAALGYLVMPIDLVPDFIPVAGQLDDAIVVALALRAIARGSGPGLLDELWPGPRKSLALLRRLV
jgi:uncharacterized membrane protein YkvA (DUF1232 family)